MEIKIYIDGKEVSTTSSPKEFSTLEISKQSPTWKARHLRFALMNKYGTFMVSQFDHNSGSYVLSLPNHFVMTMWSVKEDLDAIKAGKGMGTSPYLPKYNPATCEEAMKDLTIVEIVLP